MKGIIPGQGFDCTRAVKEENNTILYLEDDFTAEFIGVRNWDAFTLEGGD